jgi:3-polyprenyl-4-hydroxybenzoate decarboxylase
VLRCFLLFRRFISGRDSVGDIVEHSVGRMLDLFGLDVEGFKRWEGWKRE